jgi:hypothetical protein
MLYKSTLFALGLAMAAPLAAQDFTAVNRIAVTGNAQQIVVTEDGDFGARSTWCAAADFARRGLGRAGTDRLYVAEGNRNPPFAFTLDPAGLTPTSASVLGASLRTPGANLSVDHAASFCADHYLINSR